MNIEQNDKKNTIEAATSDRYTLNRWYTYGCGDEVLLIEKSTAKQKTVIDKKGAFVKFPGILLEDNWINDIGEGSLEPVVRYRTEFNNLKNGQWRVLWCVQPDGRYWEDGDGYGSCSDSEIFLYSFLASDGGFTQPFKVYSVGTHMYYNRGDT